MMKKLLITLIFMSSFLLSAQEQPYHEVVLEYLEVNGTRTQYEQATDGLFDLLRKQYASKNVPETVWAALKEESPKQVNGIMAMLVSAYRGTYEKEDIKKMLAFYQTAAGRQLLADKTAMDYDQQQKAAQFYNTETGQKIVTSEQQISSKVSELSEIWSRDLYRMMVDKLAEKGYALQ